MIFIIVYIYHNISSNYHLLILINIISMLRRNNMHEYIHNTYIIYTIYSGNMYYLVSILTP